jgi:4-amino-4-deoxy-L-arabinose transferase-like glycosyltransferase
MKRIKDYYFVAGCCGVILLLALITLYFEPTISRDGTLYLELAGVWHRDGSFQSAWDAFPDFWIPPFYLWLIQCLISIGLPPEVAGRSISVVVGMTIPLLVYLLAQEVQKDKRVSLTAAVLMAVNPTLIDFSVEIQRDILYLFLCGWTIYFCLRGILRNEIWSWIPAGVLFGCSVLTRYETLELLPLLLFAFVLFGYKKIINWKRLICQYVLMACSCLAAVVLLVYVMGVEKYISNYYQSYISSKITVIRNLYVAPATGNGEAK